MDLRKRVHLGLLGEAGRKGVTELPYGEAKQRICGQLNVQRHEWNDAISTLKRDNLIEFPSKKRIRLDVPSLHDVFQ